MYWEWCWSRIDWLNKSTLGLRGSRGEGITEDICSHQRYEDNSVRKDWKLCVIASVGLGCLSGCQTSMMMIDVCEYLEQELNPLVGWLCGHVWMMFIITCCVHRVLWRCLYGFIMPASSPEWLCNTLCALALVVMLGWWRCMPRPLRAPGLAASGHSHGSTSLLPPSHTPLHYLRGSRRCARMLSPVPAFALHRGAVFMLLRWGSTSDVLGVSMLWWWAVPLCGLLCVTLLVSSGVAWVWLTSSSPPEPIPTSSTPSPVQCLAPSLGGMGCANCPLALLAQLIHCWSWWRQQSLCGPIDAPFGAFEAA